MFSSFSRLFRLTLLILILLAVIVFTVSNREVVTLSLYPFPVEVSLPLYLFFVLTLALGYLWGLLSSSMAALRHRHAARKEGARADALDQEVSSLRAQQASHSAPKKLSSANDES